MKNGARQRSGTAPATLRRHAPTTKRSDAGAALRSKADVAQIDEMLCKALCHNPCCVIQSLYELGMGIEPEFWG